MLVIMDMEWVDWFGRISPSQIAALRVDADWKEVDCFRKLICPDLDWRKVSWNHVAFTGYDWNDFLQGSDATAALVMLSVWLKADDVLCWWSAPTAETFASAWKNLMHGSVPFSMRLIAPSIQEDLMNRGLHVKGSAYGMAKRAGLKIIEQEHCSVDDASVIRKLLQELRVDSKKILNGEKANQDMPVRVAKPVNRNEFNSQLRYVLDKSNRRAHVLGCRFILPGAELRSMGTIEGVFRSKYDLCDCCNEDYWSYCNARAQENIRKMQLNYIYSDKSGLFHKPTCVHVQRMPYKTIHGCVRYETALWSGHRPCGFCKPKPEDEKEPIHIRKQSKQPAGSSLNRYEQNALKRQAQAKKERAALPDNLKGIQGRDAFVLTQTGFAFWMAEGYETFHLRSCPKLNGLSHLRGYARFAEARKFGKPCKLCQPSGKHDILASVPIQQQVREDETKEKIDALCDSLGLKHESKVDGYYIETPVAYWKLMTGTFPLEVYHMPKDADQYHRQHRTFLSMTDTVEYIRRHDDVSVPEARQEKKLDQMLREARIRYKEKTAGAGRRELECI